MKQKRITFFALVFLCILFWAGFKYNEHSKTKIFGNWNESTDNILEEQFYGFLPEKSTAEKYGQNYYYKFVQAVLGDANFVIYIDIVLPDTTTFENLCSQYELNSKEMITLDNQEFYFIQCIPESVSEYLDDKIYDGMYYNFEIIAINRSNYTISFLSAHVWDYYKDNLLYDFLRFLL